MQDLQKYDQKELEKIVRQFWDEHKTVQKVREKRKKGKKFFLLDGPPYVNGTAHVGHFKTTVCKDVWAKFKIMQGHNVWLQPGFDTHGLPVEVVVEKELGVKSKSDIEYKIGVDKFSRACLDKVMNNEGKWMNFYKRAGAWRGWFDPYFTFKDYYIESGWWTAKKLHEKGLLYEGDKTLHWCPHCETALSGYEVSDSYADLKSPSVFLKFKIKDKKNEYLVVWTTTPWTLPSNVAVAVSPNDEYVRAKVGDDVLILAKSRAKNVIEETLKKKFEILETFKGTKLEGTQYEPLIDLPLQKEAAKNGKAHKVYASIVIMTNKKYKKHVMKSESEKPGSASGEKQSLAESEEYEHFVTMDAGSGLVHVAPGHGQTDNFFGKHYNMPILSPVNEKGRYTQEAGELEGKSTDEANKLVLEILEKEGKVLNASTFVHRAAVCWRCKTPLIFRVSKQWFMKVDPIKEKMMEENEKTRWLPSFGKVKMQNWIADREDWGLSQQRYWGIPMPIWECTKCDNKTVIGSRKELKEKSIKKLDEKSLQDLHRHTVDKIELKCSKCDSAMKRVPHIFTVWFDSGIAPWASMGYPNTNKELFEEMKPCDMICESQDQVRGWFDSLLLCGVGAFGHSSYKAVSLMGWVLDEKGEKMSKSLGNIVDADQSIDSASADAVRAYYCWEVAPWEVQKFSFKTAQEVQRALTILYNTFAFYQTYKETAPELSKVKLEVEDEWLLSRLQHVKQSATAHLENFEFHMAGREMLEFVTDDFSRWYIKLIRDRASLSGDASSKKAVLATMRHALFEILKMLAPVTPFMSEYVFQKMRSAKDEESVHFETWPEPEKKRMKEKLEQEMKLARALTEAVGSARQEANLKLRWPLKKVLITGEQFAPVVKDLQSVLQRSLNCESVEFVPSKQKIPGDWLKKELDGGVVLVPRKLDEEMMNVALFRELVRAVQESRKKNGLNVHDKITLTLEMVKADRGLFEKKLKELEQEVGASLARIAPLKGDFEASAELESKGVKARFSKD
jgi:isoleucyl-tRNA synthetase